MNENILEIESALEGRRAKKQADAPKYAVVICSEVLSICGNCSTGIFCAAKIPASKITSDTTMARLGRLTKISISGVPHPECWLRIQLA